MSTHTIRLGNEEQRDQTLMEALESLKQQLTRNAETLAKNTATLEQLVELAKKAQ